MARAWVTGPPATAPDAAELAAFGLAWEGETPDPDIGVWPENWQAWEVFAAMATQWRISVGVGGAVYHGLDYAALPAVEQRVGVKKRQRADTFARLRVMEAAAREELNRGG